MNEVWYVTEDFGSMVGNVYSGTLEECEAEFNKLTEQYSQQGKNPNVFNITLNRFDI